MKSDKFWDKSAEKYEKSKISDEESYQRKLTETQLLFSQDMHVVEFGCGTGTTAIHHAPHVKHIDATDVSENMIDIGRTKAKAAGINNITFSRGTLMDLGANEASIDVVLGLNVLHLIPDRQSVLAEAARILKPGGALISSTACIGDSPMRFIKLITPLGKLFGLMPDVYIFTDTELASEITSAGFKIENQWHHGKAVKTAFIIARRV